MLLGEGFCMDVVQMRWSVRNRLSDQSGSGAGAVILWIGGFCIASWIFFAVVDWIVATREDRQALREEQAQSHLPQKPFVPRPPAGSQVSY
jgi:hypothetical protein